MAVTATPVFPQSPAYGVAAVSTANTNRDGSGTLGTVVTAGANGTLVERVDVCASGTTTAGVVRLYITLDSGPTSRLWKEILVPALTPSVSVAAFMRSIREPVFLPSGYSLRASTHNAEGFNVHSHGGNL